MYDELVKRLKELHPETFENKWDFAFAVQQAMHEAADAIEELSAEVDALKHDIARYVEINTDLLNAAKAMHTWIFLNTADEEEAYAECGLTDEMNALLGYGGSVTLTGGADHDD